MKTTRLTARLRFQASKSLSVNSNEVFLEYPNEANLTPKQYSEIISTYNTLLLKNAIDTGDVYRLPANAGLITIIKKPTRKESLNFNIYKQTGEKVYYNNLHSDGYAAKISWKAKDVSVIEANMHYLWKFKPHKQAKKYLHNSIVQDNAINRYYDSF